MNTNRITGVILARAGWLLRIITAAIMNIDSIIPCRHKSNDMKWDRYISKPIRDATNASSVLM